jgi:hypothetical protein
MGKMDPVANMAELEAFVKKTALIPSGTVFLW